jgi:hypothetical protein
MYSTAIMLKTPAKQGNHTSKLTNEADSHRVCLAHSAKLAKLPDLPSVVIPETASYACASTSLLKRMLTTTSATSLLALSTSTQVSLTPLLNLSTAIATKLSAVIMKSPPSVVKKKAEYINFCDSSQVKTECFKYIKNSADLLIDQQSQISFLVRKFNSSAIIAAFSMLIGKVAGAAPMDFFPLPPKKEDLIQQFLCLIYNTKSMMINTEEECYRYVRAKYSYSEYFAEYFVDYILVNQYIHTLNILLILLFNCHKY